MGVGKGADGGGGSSERTCISSFSLNQQVCHLLHHLLPTSPLLSKPREFLYKCSSLYISYQYTLNFKNFRVCVKIGISVNT